MISKNDFIFEVVIPGPRKVLIYGSSYPDALKRARMTNSEIMWKTPQNFFKPGYVERMRASIRKQEMALSPVERLKQHFSKRIIVFELPDTLNQKELGEYRRVKQNGDVGKMRKSLFYFADKCPCRSPSCLNTVFCPDCPMNGLVKNKENVK